MKHNNEKQSTSVFFRQETVHCIF